MGHLFTLFFVCVAVLEAKGSGGNAHSLLQQMFIKTTVAIRFK